ncbi:MAG: hypothetical protein ACO2ZN_09830, partial [Paracoccaceae bacterium]
LVLTDIEGVRQQSQTWLSLPKLWQDYPAKRLRHRINAALRFFLIQNEILGQTFAAGSGQIHNLHPRHGRQTGVLGFCVRVEISGTA